MSLLDDVSIVVTPNGYKAGTLYGVLPVPTEGAEEITNGGFATDSDWDLFNGATISGGQANIIGDGSAFGYIEQTNTFTSGKLYKITLDAVINSGLGLKVMYGLSFSNLIAEITTTGSYTFYYTAASSTSIIIGRKTGGTAYNSSVDNVSVKEYTSADMDVTRATAATRVDENGLVNYAQVLGDELVTNGDFSDGTNNWTETNAVISASNNQLTVDDTAGAGVDSRATQNIATENGKRYILKFDRISSTSVFWVAVGNGSSYSNILRINLGSDTGSYAIEFTALGTTSTIALITGGTGVSVFSDVTVKEVTRNNVPRIDYTGGGCPHILAEPQRTNEVLVSENFSSSYWSSAGSPTITTNYGISPSGANNSVRIQGNNQVIIYNSGGFASDDSRSIFIKATSGSGNIQLLSHNSNTNNVFSIDTNWKRVELNSAPNIPAVFYAVDMRGASTNIYDVEIWGAQLEEGSFATSYIPTSGSTVTRNQDVFTRDGISSLINSTEGVLFAEIAALSDDLTYRGISIGDGTANNLVRFYYENVSNRLTAQIKNSGIAQATMTYTFSDITISSKIAIKYKENDFSLWVDGTEVATDTSGSTPSSLSSLQFDTGTGGDTFFGKVKQLQVYKTALTDMQLIQLTGTAGTDFYESYSEMAETLTYTIQ